MKTKYIYNLLLRTFVVGALLFCLGQPKVHAQQVAVKTNGLMWLAMMPNAGCEFVVGERSTVDLSAFGSMNIWGEQGKDFRLPTGIPILVQRSTHDA